MAQVRVGQQAPSFEGFDQNGHLVKLSNYTGRKVVLYFYPKDSTSGCTEEACNLRDNYSSFLKKGFVVIGVSPDNERTHKKFADQFDLPFPLIADTSKKILNDYGVWGEKHIGGRVAMGVFRTTLIINEKGRIENIISKVDTKKHTGQIFALYND